MASGVSASGGGGVIVDRSAFRFYTGGSNGLTAPVGITAGPDGALWFTLDTDNPLDAAIARITTWGKVTLEINGNGSAGITAGPDGALWFTSPAENGDTSGGIGRISTSGRQISGYSNGFVEPYGITTGPDGALWFTDRRRDVIGRMTTDDSYHNGLRGTGISKPEGIAAGPDGALWFTNAGNNSIGRITTMDKVTNYTGTGISKPDGITAGPDGALWFTNPGNNSIGRITTSGTVTKYTGTGISKPDGITAGPDGALWFTNPGNNSIGRITTSGKVTNYRSAGIAEPEGIAVGPDEALWFTNFAGGSIGRFTIANSTPAFAGYQTAATPGSPTSSAARFKVPALSCTPASRVMTPAAGVEVNRYQTFSSAFLFTGCVSGAAVYYPALVINGTETDNRSMRVSAGDVIRVAAKVTTAGTTVQITDVTTGITMKRTGAGASASAAYIGDAAWRGGGKLARVPDFGTLTFTNCLIDRKTLASWHPHKYQRVHYVTVQIAPGTLSPAGSGFATEYSHQ